MFDFVQSADTACPPACAARDMSSCAGQDAFDELHAEALAALQGATPGAAVDDYLAALLAVFPQFALQEPGSGVLDVKVLAAVETSAPYLAGFREVVDALAAHRDGDVLVASVGDFFARALKYKRPAGSDTPLCHLWADSYRYILREWFLTTLTLLLCRRRYTAAGELLARRYHAPDAASEHGESFVAFDGHVRTLDDFRCRRLRLNRVSLSADLLRQRLDEARTPLVEVMQCDFVLCLRSLLAGDDPLARWYPRTLVFGDALKRDGFALLSAGEDAGPGGPLAELLGVQDPSQLRERFAIAEARHRLQRWELGGVALDFRGFLGWRRAGGGA